MSAARRRSTSEAWPVSTDPAGVVDALMSEEHAFLQNDDIFRRPFEFGDHVRGNEELRCGRFPSMHRQGAISLRSGVARGHVQGCLDLVEEGDGRPVAPVTTAACLRDLRVLRAADRQTEAPGRRAKAARPRWDADGRIGSG